MPPKLRKNEADTVKTLQIAKEEGLSTRSKPRTQVGISCEESDAIPSDDQQGTATVSGIPKRKVQALAIYKEAEPIKQERSKLQVQQILPAPLSSSGSEAEAESDPLISPEQEKEEIKQVKAILANMSLQLGQLRELQELPKMVRQMERQLQELTPMKNEITSLSAAMSAIH